MLNPPVPISVKSCPVALSNDIATVISAVLPDDSPQYISRSAVGTNLIPAVTDPFTSVLATVCVSIYQTLVKSIQRPPLVYAVNAVPSSVLDNPESTYNS